MSIFVNVVDVFLSSTKARHYLFFAISAALIQQTLLYFGMQEYILHAPRTNFISANKEGICSIIGYLSIHYFAVFFGRLIFSSKVMRKLEKSEQKNTHNIYKSRWIFIAKSIFGSILILWTIHLFTASPNIIGGPSFFRKILSKINIPTRIISNPDLLQSLTVPSRRLLNLPYILWSVTMALNVLGGTLFFDLSIDRMSRPNLLRDAINRNSLILFLFANVLTGSINLILKTLLVRDLVGILIVCAYMLVVCTFAVFLHEKKITIRF